jgi:ATP-dependent Clp protease ATP-binding subunit ClpC
MGARPLRRAIQRYVEDPLADEVLRTPMEPGSTVEIDRAEKPDEQEPDVKISVVAPKKRKREAVGVGAKGGGQPDKPEPESSDLPDEPEVLPEVPEAPPEPEDSGSRKS